MSLQKITKLLAPSWKKIAVTLAIVSFLIAFFYLLLKCFPIRWLYTPTAREVIADKPWCIMLRNPVLEPVVEGIGAVFVYLFAVVFIGILSVIKLLPIADSFALTIGLGLFVLFWLLAAYAGTCCLFSCIKSSKKSRK